MKDLYIPHMTLTKLRKHLISRTIHDPNDFEPIIKGMNYAPKVAIIAWLTPEKAKLIFKVA